MGLVPLNGDIWPLVAGTQARIKGRWRFWDVWVLGYYGSGASEFWVGLRDLVSRRIVGTTAVMSCFLRRLNYAY